MKPRLLQSDTMSSSFVIFAILVFPFSQSHWLELQLAELYTICWRLQGLSAAAIIKDECDNHAAVIPANAGIQSFAIILP